MPDGAPEAGAPEAPPTTEPSTPDPPAGEPGPDLKAELEAARQEIEKVAQINRRLDEKVKANAQAAKDLAQLREQSMSETEKAVATARSEGRREALVEVGGRLVAAEFRTAAKGRLDDKAVDAMLTNLNTAAFLDDDGNVDAAGIAGFVDSIAPAPPPPTAEGPPADPRFPDIGQGQRGTNQPEDGLTLAIRKLTGTT